MSYFFAGHRYYGSNKPRARFHRKCVSQTGKWICVWSFRFLNYSIIHAKFHNKGTFINTRDQVKYFRVNLLIIYKAYIKRTIFFCSNKMLLSFISFIIIWFSLYLFTSRKLKIYLNYLWKHVSDKNLLSKS